MCKCTPNMRTPFCGKPGCEWPFNLKRVLPKTELEWISYALNDAETALPVLFTMLTKIGAKEGAKEGAMVADEILGHVKSAQKNCAHLLERERHKRIRRGGRS